MSGVSPSPPSVILGLDPRTANATGRADGGPRVKPEDDEKQV